MARAEIRFVGLTVRHTGTHFLGATLRHLTGLSSEGWPPSSRGLFPEPIGFSMSHLYAPTRDVEWWTRWIDGTDLPVVMTVRDEAASFATLSRMPHESRPGRQYDERDHRAALARRAELLALPRFHGFRIDGPMEEREQELRDMLAHIGAPPDTEAVREWAARWPVFNSRRPA